MRMPNRILLHAHVLRPVGILEFVDWHLQDLAGLFQFGRDGDIEELREVERPQNLACSYVVDGAVVDDMMMDALVPNAEGLFNEAFILGGIRIDKGAVYTTILFSFHCLL